MTVRFVAPSGGVETATISAFCPTCMKQRGTPEIEKIRGKNGEPLLVHRWNNKCGHIDTDHSIHREVEAQCATADCSMLASSSVHYPYCGEECVVAAGLNVIVDLRAVSKKLDGISAVLATMLVMLGHPELKLPPTVNEAAAVKLWRSNCTNTNAAIAKAQAALVEATAHGMGAYTMEGTAKYGVIQ